MIPLVVAVGRHHAWYSWKGICLPDSIISCRTSVCSLVSNRSIGVMFLIRLLIVGDSGVGKTSLLIRFHENQFMFTQKTTIGVDYKAKECEVDGELVKLQVIKPVFLCLFATYLCSFYCLSTDMGHGWAGAFQIHDVCFL